MIKTIRCEDGYYDAGGSYCKNVTSNILDVLMEHIVNNVLETDLLPQPYVLIVKMKKIMIQTP